MDTSGREPVRLATQLSIEGLTDIAVRGARVELAEDSVRRVRQSRSTLEGLLAEGRQIYGVTTGFGALVSRSIEGDQRAHAQASLLRSHAAGVGEPLRRGVVRGAMALRLNGLLQGRSGIRVEPLRHIATLLNEDLVPLVPRVGSLGASGDLAPSAHAFLPLIGEGTLVDRDGDTLPAAEGLRRLGLEPLALAAKEGLALINGTHFMAAGGALSAHRLVGLLDAAEVIASLSMVALNGDIRAFDPRVHALRPLAGQQRTAAAIRHLWGEPTAEARGGRQDAYSIRCIPQVHGSAWEGIDFLRRLVTVDLNAVTDNPLVFDEPVDVISGGNFHGQSLSLAFDVGRLSVADLASISERRTFRLVSPSTRADLPDFLSPTAGVSSGYMVVQYVAAALVAELRTLAQPVSIDSIPTSDNQEDHVSFGMTGAWMLEEAADRLVKVLAAELLCACQALEFREAELTEPLARVRSAVREVIPPLEEDRPPSDDLLVAARLIDSGIVAAALSGFSAAADRRDGQARAVAARR